MTGFGVSGVNGYPDTQLVSYAEMLAAANSVAEGLSSAALEQQQLEGSLNRGPIPCIADGDTGYGNAINAKRTVFGYARAGMAGIMIEDQVAPKRCGHVVRTMPCRQFRKIHRYSHPSCFKSCSWYGWDIGGQVRSWI